MKDGKTRRAGEKKREEGTDRRLHKLMNVYICNYVCVMCFSKGDRDRQAYMKSM